MSFANNTKWVALAQFIKILCQIMSLVVLARLIPPNEYGIMAMAGVIVALGFLFRDMGTSAALIQKETINENLKNAVFWLNVLTGGLLAVVICLLSPLAVSYFNEPKLLKVLMLLSLSFPITSLASSHLALMERDSNFKKIAYIESISSLLSTLFAIFAAYKGAGVYSLVVQSLMNALLSTLLIWKSSNWIPSLYGYKYLKDIKQIIGFSGNLVAFNFINYFSRNADRYVIGHFMASTILGAYDLAYKIMLFPLQTLTFVVSRSMLPILSKHQNDTISFNDTYLKALSWITFISFPLMTGIMVLKDQFVAIVFGNQWSLVAGILWWLAPAGMLQSMNSTTGAVLTAKGKTNVLFYTGIMSAVIYVSGFLISVKYGIIEFSKFYFYSNVLAVGLNLLILFRLIDLNLRDLFGKIFPSIVSSFLMFFVLMNLKVFFDESVLSFIFLIFLGMVLYIFFNVLLPNNLISRFIDERKRV
ncbi:lipopolysaccharide biosynthesis protein [Acinetobacter sp. SwsAc6]|uniref:lipopolysaccharide biosynthesis protein n=1 Tax=Acinetobacter sp. SwsAc6 TaxID=2749439 RepID=UPI0015B9C663|nr:lipopolysaccharide biosynthesis protein [Acinetobacter sp. SwsAc6]